MKRRNIVKVTPRKIDPVDVCKRRVALHVLKTSTRLDLSNECIAMAFGWSVNKLLNFWRQENPKFVK